MFLYNIVSGQLALLLLINYITVPEKLELWAMQWGECTDGTNMALAHTRVYY